MDAPSTVSCAAASYVLLFESLLLNILPVRGAELGGLAQDSRSASVAKRHRGWL